MRKLRIALLGVLAVIAGATAGAVAPLPSPVQAVSFADIASRPIAGPSPPARRFQMFTVWYSVHNLGPQGAENVVLTINPINDPNVSIQSITTNPPRPCSPVGVFPIVCQMGKISPGPVLAVGVRYLASAAGDYATDQVATTTSTDPNPGNNTAMALIKVTN